MKKNLLLLVLMLLPLAAIADAVEINGIYYNLVLRAKTAGVTNNPNQYTGNVVIPETVTYDGTEFSVTSIGNLAFYGCSGLTSITIPFSVTFIGSWAFFECSSLTSIHISDIAAWCSISFADYYSSPLCYAHQLYVNGEEVKDLIIPSKVTSIGSYAFTGCTSLTSVTIPNSVTSIGYGAFSKCINLTSAIIPNSVTSIVYQAFYGCSSLTSVTIPNSVTSIGYGPFQGCSNLTSVTIGSGVQTIDGVAFANCPELADVYCHAEIIPSTSADAFTDSNIENSTLHVPAASVSAYQAAEPWKNFKSIVALDGSTPGPQKCATPTISYINGKLTFDCETNGVEFVSEITSSDFSKHYGSEVSLTCTYLVSVYATKH